MLILYQLYHIFNYRHDDFKTAVPIGNKQGTGELTLSDSIQNYRFLFVSLGFYGSGFPSYGSLFIPVNIINVTGNGDFNFRVNGYYSGNTYYSIFYFLSPSKVKINAMVDQNVYIAFRAL